MSTSTKNKKRGRRTSRSPEETRQLGRALGELLAGVAQPPPAGRTGEGACATYGAAAPGTVLALCGPLGAGKTVFAQGLARGLGVPEEERVASPPFVLLRTYRGRLPFYPFDAYRLSGGSELADIGALEFLGEAGGGVSAIEWAERVEELLPAPRLELSIEITGEEERELVLAALGPGAAGLGEVVARWAKG